MAQVRIIRTAHEFAALAPQWWGLWHRAAATPFLTPAWLLPWWQTFHPGELHAIAVLEDSRLLALAPLYRDGERLLPIGIALSDYLDVLADPRAPHALCALVPAMLDLAGWEECSLEDLPPGAAALAMPAPEFCAERVSTHCACPVLVLPQCLERLADAVPAGKLRKVRMSRHRADRRGGLAIEAVGIDALEVFLRELLRLHAARWQGRGGSAVLSGEGVEAFLAAATPQLLESHLARLFLLRLGGHCAGAYFGLSDGRRAYAWLGGFDPRFARESPGTLLIAHAIEAAVSEGCREFHFLRGRERYKYDWGALERWSMRRVLTRREPGV
jgi:CelD/BcsL family acetyltransferase involved in cellulose biosynthesis